MPAATEGDAMSFAKFGLTEAQWETLVQGPLFMLAHVGGADAYVDTAEWTALIEAVRDSAEDEDAFVADVTAVLADRLRDGHVPVPQNPVPLVGLEDIAAILDGLGAGSTAYRVALMEIGAAVADASGAGLTIRYAVHHGQADWVTAPAASPAERTALATAAEALGIAVPLGRPTEAP